MPGSHVKISERITLKGQVIQGLFSILKQSPCTSNLTIGMGTLHIQEEVIIDILSRLSVKSLLRFKCVSESWNTLISEPYFKKMHINIHAKNQNSQKMLISQMSHNDIFFTFYSASLSSAQLVKDIRRLDWPSSSKPLDGRVYCCCDGLFFIGIWSKFEEQPSILLLWNPSTRESIILPRHLELLPEGYIYGMGYDSTSDDYKILRIDGYDEAPDEILALKSASWRKIDETSGRMSVVTISQMELCLAFVDGAFHWLGVFPRSVVSFNISNEMYGEIPLPVIERTSYRMVEEGVSVLGGRLCFYHNDAINFNLWVMKDYSVKESWTKWFNLPSNGVDIIPIYMFPDDEVLLTYFGSEGTVYRTSNGSFGLSNKKWPLDCDDIQPITIQDGFVYIESLISPKLGH
ncbi:F-box/kelch-repeat protein At3g06240-like [Nicotiana tabacum]|uniref:F-box/kelch-repeat protein At3g06240-like n=1 Tax=Nicotiana tabacum TaxID=4097 RepID=A0AC58UGZ3_TOBAC